MNLALILLGRVIRLGALLFLGALVVNLLLTGGRRGVPFVTNEMVWSVDIVTGPSLTRLRHPSGHHAPVLSAADVTDVPARFVADPFMMRRDGRWHMYFEVLNQTTGQGDIGYASSVNGLSWQYERIVLDEPFHLSYPQVFEEDGEVYMLPESTNAGELRLYQADAFPLRWKLVATLMKDRIADPTLLRHEGRYWIFAHSESASGGDLRLFFSDRLRGPWIEHPQSPVVGGNPHTSRPGGSIVRHHGELIRIAQDGVPTYGRRLLAMRILELNPSTYREKPLRDWKPLAESKMGWNSHGMHHLDAHQLPDGSWIGCVDGHRESVRLGWAD